MKLNVLSRFSVQGWAILLYCLFFQNGAQAQYSPYFQNYDLSQYNVGNQNWGISKADDGRIYVANNNGLLNFGGLKWTLNTLPNKTTLRSVLAVKDRIYIGSYEEFGFWERDKYGKLQYTSISEILNPKDFLSEEFWQIVEMKDAIIFRSFLNLYVYKNGEIEKITAASTIMSSSLVEDILYVSTLKNGIFILENDALKSFIVDEELIDAKVVAIAKIGEDLLISTSLKGVYIYSKRILKYWNSEISGIIKEQQLNAFSKMQNGKMVFGTIKNGIYITDSAGNLRFHIHKENPISKHHLYWK